MSKDSLSSINPRRGTPQREKARQDQIKNNAGGYVFGVNDMTRLDRFLMLGTDGGTFYVKEREHTQENAQFIIDLAVSNKGLEMVNRIVEISLQGRAPRQNYILFALAVATAYGDKTVRNAAFRAVPQVVRTGSHLFQFITYREQLAGWGRGMRTAVGKAWYNMKDAEKLAYQMVKYRTRNGWSHRDALRLSHPKPVDIHHDYLYSWATGNLDKTDPEALLVPPVVQIFENLQRAVSVDEVVSIISETRGLVSWEMIPDKFINEPRVWAAMLIEGVPQTALMRQLPRLTRIGMFEPFKDTSFFTEQVAQQLRNPELLKRARVHPINVLIAQKTYASGRGKGSTWTPKAKITDALDNAFYSAFGSVEPTGKRIMLAVDVSGSMNHSIPGRSPMEPLPITMREAAAALALVTESVEPKSVIYGFSDGSRQYAGGEGRGIWDDNHQRGIKYILTPLGISSNQRLDDVVKYMRSLNFGGTDLALPMIYAKRNELDVDAFVIYTDNETWYGNIHPYQALKQYREASGIRSKLIIVSLNATQFTVADPLDKDTLDVVGFDAAVPQMISDFIRDEAPTSKSKGHWGQGGPGSDDYFSHGN